MFQNLKLVNLAEDIRRTEEDAASTAKCHGEEHLKAKYCTTRMGNLRQEWGIYDKGLRYPARG